MLLLWNTYGETNLREWKSFSNWRVDDTITISFPWHFHPEVRTHLWRDEESDPRYTLVGKEFDTPKGKLRTVVRATEDYPCYKDIPLASDYNISRAAEFLIKGPEDLKKLPYLLYDLNQGELSRFYQKAKQVKKFAHHRKVLLRGKGPAGGDLAAYLCRMRNLFYMEYDKPGFMEELIDMIHKWEMKKLELILNLGVDMINARGCYETAPLWSPPLFNKLFAPLIKEEVEMTHQSGAKFSYFSTGSLIPHFNTFLCIGIDVLSAILTPPIGDTDMGVAKEKVGDRICLWGGVEPALIIERGTKEQVRREVINVIRVATPGGGFVLSTGGSIYNKDCYENVMTFIETVREFGTYPIDKARLGNIPNLTP